MILGMIYAVAVTRTAPDKSTKEFFNSMGSKELNTDAMKTWISHNGLQHWI